MFAKGIVLIIGAAALLIAVPALSQEAGSNGGATNSTMRRLFSYSGPLLPSDWSLVSVMNERAIIAYQNGTARNTPISELDLRDRLFLERLQNGTLSNSSNPLAAAKERLSSWSSTVTSTVSKLGKTVKEQFDHLVNNRPKPDQYVNLTLVE